ncbi:hypothetical protein [Rodentibacter myodis]|nr:hypothetical protein [Rodentibacter myodis]
MIVSSYLILYYFIILFIYSVLHFITLRLSKHKIKGPIKFLLFIASFAIFFGYFALRNYIDETIYRKRIKESTSIFLEVLQNVPNNTEIWADYDRFYASTDNLKDEKGKQPTFKWGNFELTSLDSRYSTEEVKAVSLTQPKELPKGMQCGMELYFSSKKSKKDEEGEEYYFKPESFQFSHCNVRELALSLHKQKIQLNNAILYYSDGIEKSYGAWRESVKQAASQLGLNEYWFVRLEGQVRIEKEWVANDDDIGVLFDISANPIALVVSAEHQTGLDNMKLKQCFIKSNSSTMILTNLQDEKPTLLTNDLVDNSQSPNCPTLIKVTLDYHPNIFEELSNKKELLLKNFSHLDNNINVNWNDKYPRLYSLWTDSNEHSFFWDKLNIKGFNIESMYGRKEVRVELTNDSSIKLGNFICRQKATFWHHDKPLDNSLAYENFTLIRCNIDDGILLIKNHPVKINKGKLAYFYPNEQYSEIVDFDEIKSVKKSQFKSEYLELDLIEPYPILNIANSQFYLEQAVVNTKNEIIALLGEIKEIAPMEGVTLGKCKYENPSLTLILKNFTDNDVEVSLSTRKHYPLILKNTENAYSCRDIQKQPYYILSVNSRDGYRNNFIKN